MLTSVAFEDLGALVTRTVNVQSSNQRACLNNTCISVNVDDIILFIDKTQTTLKIMILILWYPSKFYHSISFSLCVSNSIHPLLHKTIWIEIQVMFHTLWITPDLEHTHTHMHQPFKRSICTPIHLKNLLYKELFMSAALYTPQTQSNSPTHPQTHRINAQTQQSYRVA